MTVIKEKSRNGLFTVFPNPTTGRAAISNGDKIYIYTTAGEMVFFAACPKQQTKEIDLSHIPRGIYFVKIYEGEESHTEKIVVQ